MADKAGHFPTPHVELKGYDPFDGLNSPFLGGPLLGRYRLLNMVWIQMGKRSPINFRPLLAVPRVANPKGLALLLLSHEARIRGGAPGLEDELLEAIEALLWESRDKRFGAWGYGFPWQNRTFFFPRGLANTVVSAFVGMAMLRRHQSTGRSVYRDHAQAILHFFLTGLNRTEREGGICLSYSALDRSTIINTSLLAAQFMVECVECLGAHDEVDRLLPCLLSFAVRTQREDGSWPYGLDANQQWVDGFHTGYNLCALTSAQRLYPGSELERAIRKGCAYYERHLFGPSGEAYYYADTPWPVDCHSVAQAIITLRRLAPYFERAEELRRRVIDWTVRNMWDDRREAYAYQRHRFWTNRMDYNRWTQAWMHYAQAVELSDAH